AAELAARRQRRLTRLAGRRLGGLRAVLLRLAHLVGDHSRTSLVAAVFAFKLLEWWYGSGERALSDRGPKPVPPPPPALVPAKGGLPVPEDPALCALCRKPRTNPTLLATSGYVFCYACIHDAIRDRRCPVTFVPGSVDDLWRLFPGE
ncbi:hypothetical protein H632_c3745p0, partial [Helicosporidium sp. ATCC 50920]